MDYDLCERDQFLPAKNIRSFLKEHSKIVKVFTVFGYNFLTILGICFVRFGTPLKTIFRTGSQLYLKLHYLVTAFFTLRIQNLSFWVHRFILNRKWLNHLPMKEKTLGSNPGKHDL